MRPLCSYSDKLNRCSLRSAALYLILILTVSFSKRNFYWSVYSVQSVTTIYSCLCFQAAYMWELSKNVPTALLNGRWHMKQYYLSCIYVLYRPCAWLTCACLWLCCGRSLTWLCVSRKFPLGWSQRCVVHCCIWKVRPQGCDQKCMFKNCILNVKVTLSDMPNPTLIKIRYSWMQKTPGMWFFLYH